MTTGETLQRRIFVPEPLPHQVMPLSADFRFKNVKCGRRWGKTKLGLISVLEGHGPWIWDVSLQQYRRKYRGALHGGHMIWIAPNYTVANTEIWPELKNSSYAAWTDKSEENWQIDYPSGGFVRVRSADKEDSLRSAGYDGAVFDEDADIGKTVWTKVIRPALSDRRGWATFIGTPKGYNWAWDLWNMAKQDPRWLTLQRGSWENPIITQEEIDDMARDMSPTEYAQEIAAQFVAAGGNLVKETWWRWYQDRPDEGFAAVGQVVDGAWTQNSWSDYSVIATWARTWSGRYYLLDIWRDRVDFATLLGQIHRENARLKVKWGLDFLPIVIENAASGIPAIQVLRNPTMWQRVFGPDQPDNGATLLPALPVIPWPQRDLAEPDVRRLRGERVKAARVQSITSLLQGGMVFLPGDSRVEEGKLIHGANTEKKIIDFVDEHSIFGYDERNKPLHQHDDMVDTTSIGLWWLSKMGLQPFERVVSYKRILELTT